MVSIERIASQVRENCDISDAKYSGMYSICGLALRLRDLYKWEKGIEPWGAIPSAKILEWIDKKEHKWREIEDREFQNLKIDGEEYDPFDTQAVNRVLKPKGFLYGAGYAHAMKPSFFLARVEHSLEISACNVYILGEEFARDLFTSPTLLQGSDIFARRESMKYFLWDKIQEVSQSGKKALNCTLEFYGVNEEEIRANPGNIKDKLYELADVELETYIHHEIGEAHEDVFERDEWREIVSSFPHSSIEVFARGVKDVLSDTNESGRLRHIIDKEKIGSLGFYVSFLRGFPRLIFPEIISSFWEFKKTCDWGIIEEAREIGHKNARDYAQKLVKVYRTGRVKGREWTKEEIHKALLAPLSA